MKRIVVALACFLAAIPARAENTNPANLSGPGTTYGMASEFNQLVALLSDGALKDIMCRLSGARVTPGNLSSALGMPEGQVLRRINTLRDWGLVRMVRHDSATTIVEPLPGDGSQTLRRWANRYCAQGDACGVPMTSEQLRKDSDLEKPAARFDGGNVHQNISRRLKITIGTVRLLVELFDTPTAKAIYESVPFKSSAQLWGNEVYFAVPVDVPLEADARNVVESGALAFWVEGKSIAIAFGPRRMTRGQEVRLAEKTNVWGRAIDGVGQLFTVSADELVTVEAID